MPIKFDVSEFFDNTPVDTSEWKEYKIKDIFECTTGNGFIDKININKNNNGINYVTRTAMNNGVEMKISPKNLENKINNGNCITIGAESVTCFYQKDDFIKGEKVSILRNNNINIYTALFICTVMHTNIKNKFSYSRALNLSRLKELTIKLPTKDGQPDWEFMESFIKDIEKEVECLKNKIKTELIKDNMTYFDVNDWEEYRIGDLFNLKIAKSFDITNCEEDEYGINYVTRSSENNGVMMKIKQINDSLPDRANTLTLAAVGTYAGTCFYQMNDYYSSQNIFVLSLKEDVMTKNIGIFLSTIITFSNKNKYGYGRSLKKTTYVNEIIKLPTKDGKPDWEFMENYIKGFF